MAWTKEERANHCRQIGTLGGQETVRRYGVRYLRELAKAGFQTTADRYYGGSRAHALAALRLRGRHIAGRKEAADGPMIQIPLPHMD